MRMYYDLDQRAEQTCAQRTQNVKAKNAERRVMTGTRQRRLTSMRVLG
jgi:hypothetical protein